MRRCAAVLLLVASCHRPPGSDGGAGGRLEAVAVARGLVADPAKAGLVGVWANDTDRLCVVPAATGLRLGASVDYGDGQTCAAVGTVVRHGDRLRIELGACRFDARFEGDRIAFPAELPASCAAACAGRASLAALTVEPLSESGSEAATLRAANGRLLCGG